MSRSVDRGERDWRIEEYQSWWEVLTGGFTDSET